jgi:ApaG protein
MVNIFSTETHQIKISVQPQYLDADSYPADAQYMWAYHVRIKNNSKDVVQLINRYWRITDGLGVVQEVRGAGVIGLQPVIMPMLKQQ